MKNWTKGDAIAYLYDNSIELDNGCRDWCGSVNNGGYGQVPNRLYNAFDIRGAHRLMLHLLGYDVSSRSIQTRHSCDRPSCIAPAHLSTGTAADNTQDKRDRGRIAVGSRWHRATLDEEIVATIKRHLRAGTRNCDVAAMFGTTNNIIAQIKAGISWRHVDA